MPEQVFNDYFKFGFVRNPWDWQVSLYTFTLKLKSHHQHKLIKSMKNFDEYIDWRVHKDLHLQKDFFYDKDQLLVDYVGKFETLEDEFVKICNILSIDAKLPHLNASRNAKSYLDYYSNDSINMVSQAFEEDIKLFGYSMPEM